MALRISGTIVDVGQALNLRFHANLSATAGEGVVRGLEEDVVRGSKLAAGGFPLAR